MELFLVLSPRSVACVMGRSSFQDSYWTKLGSLKCVAAPCVTVTADPGPAGPERPVTAIDRGGHVFSERMECHPETYSRAEGAVTTRH